MHGPDEQTRGEASEPEPRSPGFVRTALVFYGAMGCIALVWRMFTPGESILHPSRAAAAEAWGLWPALAVGLLVGAASIALSELLTRKTSLGDALADLLGESLQGIGPADAALLALASGIGEELLFRGALQPHVGLVWASLIFGACHFLPRRELALWSVFAAVIGFAFGVLYEWTGHLAAPIAAHVLVNGVNLPRLTRRYEAKLAAASREPATHDESPR